MIPFVKTHGLGNDFILVEESAAAGKSYPDLAQRICDRYFGIGADGLILEHGAARATFLPAVWDDIADAATFVRQLKLKAGWPADFWAPDIRAWRYEAEDFGEE